MEFKDDAWSWTEENTTLEEQDGNTTYTEAGDILR